MTSNEQNSDKQTKEIIMPVDPDKNNEYESSPKNEEKMETEKNLEEKEKETEKDNNIELNLLTRKWRVKYYKLNNNGQWDDYGIGYVFCAYMENNSGERINKLIMLNEETNEEMFCLELNDNKVEFNYQRSTIMTWKEDDSDDDNSAISFQEKEGLIEIYKNIFLCQGKDIKTENLLDEVNGGVNAFEVSIQNLPNLAKNINQDMNEIRFNDFIKELKNTDYELIKQLGELLISEEKKIENLKTSASSKVDMENVEEKNDNNNKILNNDQRDENNNCENHGNNEYDQQLIYKNLPTKNIFYIFSIFKNLILIGDKSLIEALMDDELYLITFGALEYDFEVMKSIPHRKYFKNIVKFKNPLNIKNEEIIKKINQNLRLTYLRDTALSRLIEDNAVKTINTILQYNHNDIIQFFLNNTIYIEMLLDQLKNEDINVKKQACLFLSQIIECSKDVLQTRSTFSEFLFDQGILPIIGQIIEDNFLNNKIDNNSEILDTKEFIKITAVDIFIDILTTIPTIILGFIKAEKDNKLLEQFTNIMLYSDNFGIKYEIFQIYKTLIETQLKEKSLDKMELFSKPFQNILKYLNTQLSSSLTHQKKIEISSTKQIIIEILIAWFSLMNFNKQFWIEENKLNEIITNLLEETDKVTNLYTIKLLKSLIIYDDPFICNKILSEKLCNNLIKLFSDNMKKNNIIISCMMDFFDKLSTNNEMIFNNAMIFLSDFFNENKEHFQLILLRYEHKILPKKVLINYIRNDNRDLDLYMNDIDWKFNSDIFEDEDKTIDYLSRKREREENAAELDEKKIFDNYNKKYGSNNEYSNKMMNNQNTFKNSDEENEEGKNDDLFNFEINNIEQNDDNGDEDEDDKYSHLLKK